MNRTVSTALIPIGLLCVGAVGTLSSPMSWILGTVGLVLLTSAVTALIIGIKGEPSLSRGASKDR